MNSGKTVAAQTGSSSQTHLMAKNTGFRVLESGVQFEQQAIFVSRTSMVASRSLVLRSDSSLSDDLIHRVASPIFAEAPHECRSQRYAYIPHRHGAGRTVQGRASAFHGDANSRLPIRSARSQRNHSAELARWHQQLTDVGQEGPRYNINIQSTLTILLGVLVRIVIGHDLVLRPYQPLFFNKGTSR